MPAANGGEYGSVPQSIEQVSAPSQYASKKRFRKRLFVGLGIVIAIVFVALMVAMIGGYVGVSKFLVYDALFKLDEITDKSVPSGCETTIVIVRHCEKAGSETFDLDGNQHCSYVGFERAAYFASLFGEDGYPLPAEIYALSTDRGGHKNYREIEMMIPLAKKTGLEIQSKHTSNKQMGDDVLAEIASGKLCGKSIVIGWKHEMIGQLARNLACHECPRTFPNAFDPIWQLKYVYDVKGTELYTKIYAGEEALQGNRRLGKKKHKRLPRNWSVYWTNGSQGFDPLKFSNKAGDYAGNPVAASWASDFIKTGEM
eukprot:scaffold7025_cov123-Cylindrotheca_fusiformis.AAC.4